MADFEPVEIDFMYGGNTQAEGARIIKTTEEIAAAQVKAKADIERHNAAILELKKDLVGLGTAYKQAMSTQQKSEILTEIELTKKNILDETAAVKQLKAELLSLNKVPASSPALDAQKVGKAAVGYNSLSFSTQQLVRELPAATMGLNTFFLAISNNIPVLIDGIKRTKAEVESLKAKNIESVPVWKQLLSSLVSWQSAMMIGITIFAMYGKDIIAWGKELLTGEKAVKKLTDAQLGLTRANETMIASLNSGSEYKTAVTNIEKLSTALRQAKGNHELETKAVDDYNGSLGETFGKAKNVDEALGMIARNKDAYIKAMQDMSFANAFFAKSADDAMKAMEVGLKSQQQILKESGADNIGLFEKWQAAVKETEDAKKKLDSMKAEGKDTFYTEKYYQSRLSNQNIFARQIQELEAKERARQLAAINKHQEESQNLAKNYYKSSIDIFKQNGWETEVADDKANKEKYNAKKAITDLILDLEAQRSKMELEMQSDSLQKRLKAIDLEEAAEIRKIQEKEAAIVEAYNKSHKGETGFTAKTTLAEVDPEQAAELSAEKDGISSAFDQKRFAAAEKWKNELLQLAQKYGDERERIEGDYNARIQKLAEAEFILEAAQLAHERDRRLSFVTESLIKESDLYRTASGSKLDVSRETTALLIADLQRRIAAEIAAGRLSKELGDSMLADLKNTQVEVGIEQNRNNPFARLGVAVGNNTDAQQAYSTAKNQNAPTAQLAELESAANKARKEMALAAAESLQGVSSILSSVVGGLDKLGLLTDEQKKDAENVIGMVGGAANIAMGIATGNPMAIIQGSVDLLVNAIEFFDFKNKALVKSQKEHMKNVEELELRYKKLQRAVETALGTDVYANQRLQIENQKKQISEYEQWLILESQKKKRKQDAAKIAETKAKIEELKNSIADEARAIAEALAQTDAKSLANELADAITTAFQSGEDAALAFGDVAEQVMQNAVKNALKLQFLEKPMQTAVEQLAKDIESGGQLTSAEQNDFRNKIETAGKLYYEQLAQYSDLFTGSANTPTGIKGDIAKMTEETGSALVGQITALRFNVAGLLANSKSSLDQVSRALDLLGDIRSNTDRLQRIDETLYYLKINGIKVN